MGPGSDIFFGAHLPNQRLFCFMAIDNLALHIIEYGKNAYRKWSDGTMEAWRCKRDDSWTYNLSGTWGNLYISSRLTWDTSGGASQFTSIESVQLTFDKCDNAGVAWPILANCWVENGSAYVQFFACGPVHNEQYAVSPNIMIRGRWD